MTGRWRPGESGNPRGRPKGSRNRSTLMREGVLTDEQVGQVVAALLASALEGDTAAASALLDRAIPRLKPVAGAVEVDLPAGTLTEQARAVFVAAAGGQLPPDVAERLLAGLGTLGRITELDELTARLERLEAAHGVG